MCLSLMLGLSICPSVVLFVFLSSRFANWSVDHLAYLFGGEIDRWTDSWIDIKMDRQING